MKYLNKIFATTFILVLILVHGALNDEVLGQVGTWTSKAPMPTARWGLSADAINGIIYVVGGVPVNNTCNYLHTVEAYNPATNTWSTMASMPTGRESFDVGVVNNILYAVGGGTGCGVYVPIVEAYDPVSNSWTTKAPMPTQRRQHGIGVVNGILYAIGGHDNVGLLSSILAYNPVTDTWTSKAPIPTPRSALGVGVVNGVIYAVGGVNGVALTTVEAYDPAMNTWTTKAVMPRDRYSPRVEMVNGILYVIGGSNNIGYISEVDAYNPVTNTWTTVASIPTSRTDHAVAVANGVLYAVGGHNGNPLATNEAFTPCINTSSNTTITACDQYLWNGVLYTTSGDKTYTTTNAAGCDSVATLHLTIVDYPIVNAGNDAMVFFGNSTATQGLNCTTLVATVTNSFPGSTFNWISLPTSTIPNNTNSPITVCPTVNTNYVVTYTTPFGCVSKDTVLVKAIDVSCGSNDTKVKICITTLSGQQSTICVATSAVESVLANNPNAVLGDCSAYNIRIIDVVSEENKSNEFRIYPNPSNNYFTLQIGSDATDHKTGLRIMDLQGRLIEIRNNLTANQILQIGSDYKPGVYIAEILQGNKRRFIKLVKL